MVRSTQKQQVGNGNPPPPPAEQKTTAPKPVKKTK